MHCFLSLVQAMGAPLKTDDCLLKYVIGARLLSNVHPLHPVVKCCTGRTAEKGKRPSQHSADNHIKPEVAILIQISRASIFKGSLPYIHSYISVEDEMI